MVKYIIIFILIILANESMSAVVGDGVVHDKETYKVIDTINLQLDIFYTKEQVDDKNKPAILFFHGGGWAYGSSEKFFTTCERYAKLGFVTFAVSYRLSNYRIPGSNNSISPIESLMDAKSAMRWVRANAERFNINPDKIVASGQSAGGHLAISTAMIEGVDEESDDLSISCVPNAVVLFSAAVNTVQEWCDYMLADRRNLIWSISPAHNITKGLPPMIHFHGKEDPTVPCWAVRYFKKDMDSYGNDFELILYDNKKHLLGEGCNKYSQYFDDEVLRRVDQFLIKNKFLSSKN